MRTGRRTKLRDDLQTKIVSHVRAGVPIETAAAACGIEPSTYYRWLQRGQDEIDPDTGEVVRRAELRYRRFREAIERARAEAEATSVIHVNLAGQRGDWRASAWFLERSIPQRWGRRDALNVVQSGTIDHRVTHQFARRIMEHPAGVVAASQILALFAGVAINASDAKEYPPPETTQTTWTRVAVPFSDGDE